MLPNPFMILSFNNMTVLKNVMREAKKTMLARIKSKETLAHDHALSLVLVVALAIKDKHIDEPGGYQPFGYNYSYHLHHLENVEQAFGSTKFVLAMVKKERSYPGGPYVVHVLDVPGGKCEKGENTMDCVLRELQEETSIDLNKYVHKHEKVDTHNGNVYIRVDIQCKK